MGESTREKIYRVYVGFIDLEKAYDREALWQVLRMYDVVGKLLASFMQICFCGESEVDLRSMIGRFLEVCRRERKVNAGFGI